MDYMDLAVPRKPLNLIPHPLTHYVQKQVYMPVSEWLNVDFCPDIIVPYAADVELPSVMTSQLNFCPHFFVFLF